MEEELLKQMLETYEPKNCDWMGYPISKKNPLSYRVIVHNSLDNVLEKALPRNYKIYRKVIDVSTHQKGLTVVQKCHLQRSIINNLVERILKHNLSKNQIALVTQEGLKKLERIEKISPNLFDEYMDMFQIINDMECPPVSEINKLMLCLQKRLETDLDKQNKREYSILITKCANKA